MTKSSNQIERQLQHLDYKVRKIRVLQFVPFKTRVRMYKKIIVKLQLINSISQVLTTTTLDKLLFAHPLLWDLIQVYGIYINQKTNKFMYRLRGESKIFKVNSKF